MCTAISMQTDTHYFGRNLDLEYGYNETVTVTPRNFVFPFRHTGTQKAGCGMIGMATVVDGYPLYYEATNEWGLSAAGLNFPGLAHYGKPDRCKENVAVFELIPWMLCRCKNMGDVRAVLPRLNIVDTAFNQELTPTPLHWMIADKDECLILEPAKDGLKWYKNPIGIMTNGPEFPYHLNHLKDFQSLSPLPPQNRFGGQADMTPYSGAMGAMGLPGDWSSASRFVRAAFTACNTPTLANHSENVNQFFRVLQTVAMPMGSVQIRPGLHDFTRYSCCCETKSGKYYYTTYANSRITCVDLHKCDLEANAVTTFPLRNDPDIYTETER